jgi:fatty acid desaturase
MNDVSSYNLVQAIRGPIMLIALGTLVAMDYFGVYGFGRTWPILIILFGTLKLLEKVVARPVIQDSGPTGGTAI